MKRVVAELDPDEPIRQFTTVDQVLTESVSYSRFYMRLLGIFAGMAVRMAMIGIYVSSHLTLATIRVMSSDCS